jgi:hypothetical protein
VTTEDTHRDDQAEPKELRANPARRRIIWLDAEDADASFAAIMSLLHEAPRAGIETSEQDEATPLLVEDEHGHRGRA